MATVLGRIRRPYSPADLLVALAGRNARVARRVAGELVATSAEADALLDAMPRVVRSLTIATTDAPERCHGELRGPVLWAETLSARSATAGDPGLFVCATTKRAYDTEPNRVLVAALETVRRAGSDASRGLPHPPGRARQAKRNAVLAERFLEHPTLSGVARHRAGGRAMQRARRGSRRSTYQPALALLARAGDPLTAELLADAADERGLAGAELLARVLVADVAMATRARRSPIPLQMHLGRLVAGPIRYRHPGREEPSVTIADRSLGSSATEEDILGALTAAGVNL